MSCQNCNALDSEAAYFEKADEQRIRLLCGFPRPFLLEQSAPRGRAGAAHHRMERAEQVLVNIQCTRRGSTADDSGEPDFLLAKNTWQVTSAANLVLDRNAMTRCDA